MRSLPNGNSNEDATEEKPDITSLARFKTTNVSESLISLVSDDETQLNDEVEDSKADVLFSVLRFHPKKCVKEIIVLSSDEE